MMKKINTILFALAGLLIMSGVIDSAWAYFTTYAEAAGSISIELGDVTEIEEEISEWTKRVEIASAADSGPVYIRAKAFSGSEYTLSYSSEGGWSDGNDGYWYYDQILYGGEKTEGRLLIKIEGVPKDAKAGDDFNVIVVYESTPVLYEEDGTPYADWEAVLDTGKADMEDATQKEGE